MSGTCKRAAFAMVGAAVMLVVSAAGAGAGASRGPSVLVRIESARSSLRDSRSWSRTRARGTRSSRFVAFPAPTMFRISRG
jgi:hypothetical protein